MQWKARRQDATLVFTLFKTVSKRQDGNLLGWEKVDWLTCNVARKAKVGERTPEHRKEPFQSTR